MRFIRRAVSTVFKGGKRLVSGVVGGAAGAIRSIRKPLAIAGLVFLTAGLGTVGFGALNMSGGLMPFLQSVGQTTMAGAQGLAGALGIGGGVSAGLAQSLGVEAGTTLFSGAAASALGFGSAGSTTFGGSALQNMMQKNAALFGNIPPVHNATRTGSTILGGLGKFLQTPTGRSIGLAAVMGGAQAWQAQREYKRDRKVTEGLNFFGGPAHGGSGQLSFEMPSFSRSGSEDRTPGQQTSDQLVSAPTPGDLFNQNPDGLFDNMRSIDDFMDEINQPSPLFRGMQSWA